MTRPTARGALAGRIALVLALGLPLAGLAQPAYGAEQSDQDAAVVTISVTIDEFDPCAVAGAGCGEPGGGLAATGVTAIGVPIGAGVLLVAVGAGIRARARRRRELQLGATGR